MRQGGQRRLLFKILGVIAALVFIGFGFKERMELSHLQQHGKRALVDAPSQFMEFKQPGTSVFTAEFRFTTEGGQKVLARHSVPEELMADLRAGKPVEIVYRADDPSRFVFAKQTASWMLVAIGAGMLLAVLILL